MSKTRELANVVNGQLDNRYYTEAEINASLATKADISYVDAKPTGLSVTASNVLLNQSSLSLDDYAVTKNFTTVTYTGNGTSQNIVTGISSVDFTVSGNGSGYYHDRSAGDCIVKNDAGTIIESGSCVCNVSQVHTKSRTPGGIDYDHVFVDGVRGVNKRIFTNLTLAESINASISSFNANGFEVSGSSKGVNENLATYVAYQTLYTHIRWGLTNQNKRYIEAYNPITGDTMIMYQGSGVAGHQIPHSLGRKLDFAQFKNLNAGVNWIAETENYLMYTNLTNADAGIGNIQTLHNINNIELNNTLNYYNATDSYILYGKSKSQNWTIVQYQGTGASGNFVETKDVNGEARRPRRVIIKRTDSTGNWYVVNSAVDDERLYLNLSNAGTILDTTSILATGFESGPIYSDDVNASGGQYIALVEFDTNGDGGDSYFNLPTDDSVLNVTSGKFTSTNGLNDSGYDVALETVTGSIDFSTATDGINWVAKELGGGYSFYTARPKVVRDIPTGTLTEYRFCLETGLWYDLTSTPLATPISFLPYPWMVANGTPMYEVIDVEPLADVVANNVEFSKVVADNAIINGEKIGQLGVNQTWQDVTASRSAGVTYKNTSGKPIAISVRLSFSTASAVNFSIDGHIEGTSSASVILDNTLFYVVPNGSSYSASVVVGTASIYSWLELR